MSHFHGRTLASALFVATMATALTCGPSLAQTNPPPKPQAPPAAAPQQPAAAQRAATQDEPSPWIKRCQTDPSSKKEVCSVTQELRAETGQFIAALSLTQMAGEKKIALMASVPPGMLIEPGMRVQIDNAGKETQVKFDVCFPNACFGQVEVPDDLLASLKKGSVVTLAAANAQAKVIKVPFRLTGFTKSFEGKGLDVATAKQKQDELNKVLQERAKTARDNLIKQQQKETTAN